MVQALESIDRLSPDLNMWCLLQFYELVPLQLALFNFFAMRLIFYGSQQFFCI